MPNDEDWPLPIKGDGPISNFALSKSAEIKGTGSYVSPKPNRLILIRGGRMHYTNPINPDAGDGLRCSVLGFISFDKNIGTRIPKSFALE
jgi:hypothetical protein